ncbi:MAG: hypothetical protein KKE44_25000 [Proteobacteria bacterium]|nr:hypothetical protein [Pseudomonadota bacterium]MBU1585989.1 hypothetical protein [Pseudomonadota bacterium]MBU2453474.1 hypothetical protein [Pseudomonadota bacterium]
MGWDSDSSAANTPEWVNDGDAFMGGDNSSRNNSPPTPTEPNANLPSGAISAATTAISNYGTGLINNALEGNVRLEKSIQKITEFVSDGLKRSKQLGVDVSDWKIARLAEKVKVGKSAISAMKHAAKLAGRVLPVAGIVLDVGVDRYLNPGHSIERSALPAFASFLGATAGAAGTVLVVGGSTVAAAPVIVGVAAGVTAGYGVGKLMDWYDQWKKK